MAHILVECACSIRDIHRPAATAIELATPLALCPCYVAQPNYRLRDLLPKGLVTMRKRSHARRRKYAARSTNTRRNQWFEGITAYFLLTVAGVLTLAAGAVAVSHRPSTAASGGPNGTPNQQTPTPNLATMKHTCGFPGVSACADSQVQWIPVKSLAPSDILAAAKSSNLYNINADGRGDTPSLANIGMPELVSALALPKSPPVADYYDIPIQGSAGAVVGVVLCELNPANSAIAVVAIVQYGKPHVSGSIAAMSETQAISNVSAAHHTTLRSGAQARLVYFAFDFGAQETGKLTWIAGGESPDDPLWDIPGADGQDHIVGSDGHVYYLSELPIMTVGS